MPYPERFIQRRQLNAGDFRLFAAESNTF